MKNFYKTILVALVIFSFSTTAKASHISGVDFNYQCVGQDSFLVTFNVFRDCSGVSAPATASTTFTSSCGSSFNQSLILLSFSGTEVSQLCPASLANSSCSGGPLPGMQHYIYVGIVVLPSNCNDWTMSWSSCCRNASVNLVNSVSTGMYIDATINTSVNSCNNSPVFSDSYIKYVALNQAVSHTFTVTEIDGDSLTYHFTEPMQSDTSAVNYSLGYSYQQPIPGITLDTVSGLVNFIPTIIGNYFVAVEVCEYEYGTGLLKGCITRDIEYVVLNDSNNIVQADPISNYQGGGLLIGAYDVEVCAGDSISFDIIFTDLDTADSISIVSNIGVVLPGATLSSTGGNPDTVSFNWLAQGVLPPLNTFVITASDDACPVYSSISVPVNIHLITSTYVGSDQTICLGSQWVPLPAVGGSIFNWSVLSGSPIDTNSASPNYNMTCTNCQNPQVSPQVTTTYIVNSNLSGSCSNTDTVTVNVVPDFTLTMPNDTLICSIDDYQLNVFTNQPFTYDYQWSPAFLLDNDSIQNPVANPVETTTYYVTVTSSDGCTKSDDVFIELSAPFPSNNIILGDTVICAGFSGQLSVGFGPINYESCGPFTQPCNGNNQNGVIGTSSVTNALTSYPSIYSGAHWGSKYQILYKASELNSLGMQNGGFINSIAFFINFLGGNTTYNNFQIKMGCVVDSSVANGWLNPNALQLVVPASSYTASAGWNTHSFSQPYLWDGQSNIVVEICFNNYSPASPSTNSQVKYTTTGFQSVIYQYGNDSSICQTYLPVSLPGVNISNSRPNTQFNFCTGIDSNAISYAWSPSIGLSATNIQNPIANPAASINYQIVVSDAQGICKDTLYHYMDVVTQFDAGFSSQSPYCINDTLDTLLPNVGNGVFIGNAISLQGVFDPTLAGIGIWPINYSITSPSACANDTTINIEVVALPDASIQYQEVCFGSAPVFLTPLIPGGIFSGTGITDSVNGVFVAAGLAPGIYNITYTLAQPCSNSQITGIKVIEPYNFIFNQNIVQVCQDDTIDLSSNYTLSTSPNQGSGPVNEFWSNSNGYVDSNGIFSSVGVPYGDYIVELTITDTLGGCGSTRSMTVRVLEKNYPQIPSGLTFCESDGLVIIDVLPWLFGSSTFYTQTPIAPLGQNDTLQITQFGTNGRFNTITSGTGSWEFMVSYTNLNGCTGVTNDTINVLPNPGSDSVIQNQTVLTAFLGGGYTYQWLDCSNNMAPVSGATNQSFTPAVTGDYAVKISAGNCSITSGCYYGWSVGVEKIENELGISIFPNPTKDAIQIDRGDNQKVEIQIIDFTGKLILKQSLQNSVTTIDLSSFANGVYIIKMNTENGSSTQRIIKN